jgi:phosphonate transport system ATP-binding protein
LNKGEIVFSGTSSELSEEQINKIYGTETKDLIMA